MPRLSTIIVYGLVLAAGGTSAQILDIHGQWLAPFAPPGRANVLFFVSSDCPISNSYAPEIQRLCELYATRGVGCSLLYEDLPPDAAAVRRHLDEYGYRNRSIRAAVDSTHAIARAAHASITPQAVVVDATSAIRYRGRIDNLYAAVGKPRHHATAHDLRDALDAVLSNAPVPSPETQALGCAIAPPGLLKK